MSLKLIEKLTSIKILNDWKFLLMFCLTLGLAPFFPEPHIWGKVKWMWGGAVGMQPLDWFDALFHGLPWLLLARFMVVKFSNSLQTTDVHESVDGSKAQ